MWHFFGQINDLFSFPATYLMLTLGCSVDCITLSLSGACWQFHLSDIMM